MELSEMKQKYMDLKCQVATLNEQILKHKVYLKSQEEMNTNICEELDKTNQKRLTYLRFQEADKINQLTTTKDKILQLEFKIADFKYKLNGNTIEQCVNQYKQCNDELAILKKVIQGPV